MTDKEYLVALSTFLPFGPVRLKLLLDYFGDSESVWKARSSELLTIGLKSDIASKFIKHRSKFDLDAYFDSLSTLSIATVTKNESEYPQGLKEIDSAPFVLHVKGNIKKSDYESVAIVGTRSMSSYGRDVCSQFAGRLSESGLTIISGLALGIDAVAHRSALMADGRTIAVLASGLDTISPITNISIADEIVKRDLGAVVSEYPLATPPLKGYFPHRNRLISGLSKAVLVVEGRVKSGTIHTAHHAASQGKTVFAIPGNINSPLTELPHYLIREGAKMAISPADILQEFDTEFQVDREAVANVLPSDETEQVILELLSAQSMQVDEIIRETKLDTHFVTAKLTMMELKGLIKQMDEGVYGKRD